MSRRDPATIIPTLRYRDATAAIEWLCRAFGFTRHLVVPGEAGTIAHAQLICGNSMIMLGTAVDDEFGRLQRTPAQVGGVGTQSPYIIVPDADAHYARAVAAGAKVVSAIRDEPYGGRGYSCLDPEGHLWNFGTYDPWFLERADRLLAKDGDSKRALTEVDTLAGRMTDFRMGSLDHLHLLVPDRYEAARWYKENLGFEIVERYKLWADVGGPLHISADGGRSGLALFERGPHTHIKAECSVAFRVGADEFIAFAEGLQSSSIRDASGEPLKAESVVDFDLCYAFYFQDPYGNEFELDCYEYGEVRRDLIERLGITPVRKYDRRS